MHKGASTTSHSEALDGQIVAQRAGITEAKAKHAAKEECAREQDRKLDETANTGLDKQERTDEARCKLNMTDAEIAAQNAWMESEAATLAIYKQVLAEASKRRQELAASAAQKAAEAEAELAKVNKEEEAAP